MTLGAEIVVVDFDRAYLTADAVKEQGRSRNILELAKRFSNRRARDWRAA
jgi:hypothetical protein